MDLSELVVFAALIVKAAVMARKTRFARHPPLEDRNMTTGILSADSKQHIGECASFCVEIINCESFIYSPESNECQLHNMVFTAAGASKYQPGLRYHYMIKEGTTFDWCPLQDGYQLLAQEGPCIKFHFDPMTWHEANESCSAYGPNSRLVVLDTQEKNDLVVAAATAIGEQFVNRVVAIGLSELVDNLYRWVNGRNVTFSDWGSDFSELGREDCVWLWTPTWKWKPTDCNKDGQRICEIVE